MKKKTGLDKDQKDFIKNKVKEIGSQKGVNKFYFSDDAVSKYAKSISEKLKLPEGIEIKRRKKKWKNKSL